MPIEKQGNWLLYDGECPFCRNYVRMVNIRKLTDLELLDARHHPDQVQQMRRQGYEINQGMILKLGGTVYFGSEVMFILSNLGSNNRFLNIFLKIFFLNRKRSSIFYPFCVFVRNLTLSILRIHKIS